MRVFLSDIDMAKLYVQFLDRNNRDQNTETRIPISSQCAVLQVYEKASEWSPKKAEKQRKIKSGYPKKVVITRAG